MDATRRERRAAVVCLAIFLAGWLVILLPPLAGADGMRGGYALFFVGIFVVVSSFVAFLVFWDRADVASRMRDPSMQLAHWHYSSTEWKAIVREEKGGNGTAVLGGFALAVLFLLIGLIFFYIRRFGERVVSCDHGRAGGLVRPGWVYRDACAQPPC